MQVINNTPFPAIGWPSSDSQERQYITTLVRVKYRFDTLDEDGIWHLKFDPEQGELFNKDIFYDEKKRHVQYESDFVPYKRQADLIVNLSPTRREYGQSGIEVVRYQSLESKKSLLKENTLKYFGFLHRSHDERMQWVGTLDKKWIETKAPVFPDDFNEKHYNAAHPKMQLFQSYFEPGDAITLHKLLKGRHQQTVLIPGVYLQSTPKVGHEKAPVLLAVDTIIFDIEDLDIEKNSIYMSYRSRVEIEGKAERVTIDMSLEEALIEKEA